MTADARARMSADRRSSRLTALAVGLSLSHHPDMMDRSMDIFLLPSYDAVYNSLVQLFMH